MYVHAIPLKEYMRGRRQVDAAADLKLSQSSISRMARSARDIWVGTRQDGTVYVYEIVPVGTKAA